MAKQASRSARTGGTAPRPRRLNAEARRSSILKAARKAFTETGDMNGTTIRHIADRAGISEGIIYRHFASKDQLFIEAVVDPLRQAIDDLVAASQVVDKDEPLTPERQLETMNGLYRQLTATLEEILPLLGLVLFGDPKVARRFYRENLVAAMDRLADAWREVEARYGFEAESPDISARAVMGSALILALEGQTTTGSIASVPCRSSARARVRGSSPSSSRPGAGADQTVSGGRAAAGRPVNWTARRPGRRRSARCSRRTPGGRLAVPPAGTMPSRPPPNLAVGGVATVRPVWRTPTRR